jgi:sulfur-oxidizing protein SoxY
MAGISRRAILHTGGQAAVLSLMASAGLLPRAAWAQEWNKAAFDTKSLADAVRALGGAAPQESKDVQLNGPDIAENGAVVPVGVKSLIAGTTQICILVEKNPNILAAVFDIPEGTDAEIATRVKMGQSSNVFAVVKASGKYYYAGKEIKVTLGGCGG